MNDKLIPNGKNAEVINYYCGHYIHYYKSNEISNEIKQFATKLK